MRSITKDEYLEGLRLAGVEGQEHATPAPEATPAPAGEPAPAPAAPEAGAPAPAEAAPPAGQPPAVEGNAAPAPAAGETGGSAPAPPAPSPGGSEPFPGYNLLDETTRTALKARFDEADRKAAEQTRLAEQRQRELAQMTGRLAPAQSALSRLQNEHQQMQQRLAEAEKQRAGIAPQLKARLDTIRENYPDDAALFDTAFAEADRARQAAEETRAEMTKMREQMWLTEQRSRVSAEHPGWEMTVKSEDFGNWLASLDMHEQTLMTNLGNSPKYEDAAYVLRRYRGDTTFNHPAFAVWFNALDPASQQNVSSQRRQNPMQVIGWFENDMAQARSLAMQSAAPTAAAPPAPVRPIPTPAPDPDPTRRQTAPPTSAAGQPMSDRKREYLAAADWIESQRTQRSRT